MNAHGCQCGLACVLNKIRLKNYKKKGRWRIDRKNFGFRGTEVVDVRWLCFGGVRRPLIANVLVKGRLQFTVGIYSAC